MAEGEPHGDAMRGHGRLQAGWRLLSQASERGSAAVNEDAAGLHGRHAWIIDGSAFFSGPARIAESSEGAWLVATVDRWLRHDLPDDVPLSAAAAALAARLVDEDARLGPAPPERRAGEGPLAVFALLRLVAQADGFRLDAMMLGDVSVLIADRGRVTRWTDERVQPFEARTIAAASAAGRGGRAVIASEAFAQVIENRRFLNREGGYWAVGPGQPWQAGLRFMSQPISADATLLLGSDGFMRLVDGLGAYSDTDLVAAAAARGVESLIAELREIEREDGDAARFARVKIHDDATALLIKPA